MCQNVLFTRSMNFKVLLSLFNYYCLGLKGSLLSLPMGVSLLSMFWSKLCQFADKLCHVMSISFFVE